jgi:hypothetical protein
MEYRGLKMPDKSPIATVITIDYTNDGTSSAPSPEPANVEKNSYLIFVNNLDIDITITPDNPSLFHGADELKVSMNGGMNAVRVKNGKVKGSYSYDDGLGAILAPRTGTIDIS